MAGVPYYLVCHATKTRCYVGYGVHTLEMGVIDAQALLDFLHDNALHPLVVEWGRVEIQAYVEYAEAMPTEGTK